MTLDEYRSIQVGDKVRRKVPELPSIESVCVERRPLGEFTEIGTVEGYGPYLLVYWSTQFGGGALEYTENSPGLEIHERRA